MTLVLTLPNFIFVLLSVNGSKKCFCLMFHRYENSLKIEMDMVIFMNYQEKIKNVKLKFRNNKGN